MNNLKSDEKFKDVNLDRFYKDVKRKTSLVEERAIELGLNQLNDEQQEVIKLRFCKFRNSKYRSFEFIDIILKVNNSKQIYELAIKELNEKVYDYQTNNLKDFDEYTANIARAIMSLFRYILKKYKNFLSDKIRNEFGNVIDIIDEINCKYVGKNLIKNVYKLKEKEAKSLIWRFGLENGKKKTFDEIGKKLGMGKEGARQLINRAVMNLVNDDNFTESIVIPNLNLENFMKFLNFIKLKYSEILPESICNTFDYFKNTDDFQKRKYFRVICLKWKLYGTNIYFDKKIQNEYYEKCMQKFVFKCYEEYSKVLIDKYDFSLGRAECIGYFSQIIFENSVQEESIFGKILINDCLDDLTQDEKEIVSLKYALNGGIPKDESEIARIFNISILDVNHKLRISILKIRSLAEKLLEPMKNIYILKTTHVNIEYFEFSYRTRNCLKRVGINNLNQILRMPSRDLKKIKGLGSVSYEELMRKVGRENELRKKYN